MTPLLEARGLGLALPDRSARRGIGRTPMRALLHGIDLEIRRGECLGLVGESGSGKTTLGRTLLRLHRPTAGRLAFDGVDIARADERSLQGFRARAQFIFQDPASALNPRLRIATSLARPLLLHGRAATERAAHARVAALLEEVGLPADAGRRYPHQLSGGQRQRIGIARAIALEPDLVVADEIVSGQDVSTQARILLLLSALRARHGMAMIFIAHDLAVVRAVCDRVAVMHAGRIEETGPIEEVFRAPRAACTRALLDCAPLPEVEPGWLDRAPGTAPDVSGRPLSP
jgi:peptide/nickel transport system ATP-binding protein